MFLIVRYRKKPGCCLRQIHKPSVCEDDVSLPDFGDGVLGDLLSCQCNPGVNEFVNLLGDACLGLWFGQRRRRLRDDIPQSLPKNKRATYGRISQNPESPLQLN